MLNHKKLLVVGASYLQLPAILKAKEMGLKVAVADYDANAMGKSYADKFYNVSTIDEIGIYEAAKDYGVDGIITLATDMPMRAVAYACEKLGLTGISYDAAIKATDKAEMIKAFAENNVAHPWYFVVDNIQQIQQIEMDIKYPCICKPVDSSGSRGVVLVTEPSQLESAVAYSASCGRNSKVIIEEYMEGNEVSVEILVVNGLVHVLAVTDKITTGAPHFVEMRHSQPSNLPPKNILAIKQLAEQAVLALDIKNGPAHVEIMLTQNGPKIIELGARMGGDFITTHLVPLSTGINMAEAAIKIACNESVQLTPKFSKGSAVQYIKAEHGQIQSIKGIEDAKDIDGIIEAEMLKKIGDTSTNISNSSDRLGYIIAQGNTNEMAIENCQQALSKITIDIK